MGDVANASRSPADDSAAGDVIREAAREGCFDWYVSALLAPRRVRPELVTLAAFAGEVARVPALVTEPMVGAIRLQWWRDVVSLPAASQSGHPVADALRRLSDEHCLATGSLVALIDAQELELQVEPPEDWEALANHFGKAWGGLMRLDCRVLSGAGARELGRDVFHHAATAYGAARLAAELATGARGGGQTLVPGGWPHDAPGQARVLASVRQQAREALSQFRRASVGLPKHLRPAFLPIALVGSYVAVSEASGKDGYGGGALVSPFRRMWRMLMAHMTGRI